AGKIGEYPENVKVKDLSLDGEPVVMEGVSLGENKREIRLVETRKAGPTKWYAGPMEAAPKKVGFTDSDMGKYMVMPDGNVYIIERIITDTRARVRHWGLLPNYQDPLIKKYDRIRFGGGSIALPDIAIPGIFDDLSRFKEDDTGQFVVWDNGMTFRITGVVDSQEVAVKTMGVQEPSIDGKIKKYGTHKGLRFIMTLGEEFPEVTPFGPDGPAEGPDDPHPLLKVLCSNIIESEDYEEFVNTYYEYFKEIALESVKLDVKVENLTDVELRNDGFVLNPKTSFQPFGNSPRAGMGLYFSHPELSQKRLDSLDMEINWMNCPEDFGEYYYAYAASGLRPAPPGVGNASFKVHLKIFDKRSWRGIDDPKSLFDESDARALHRISFNKMDHEGYATDPSPTETDTNNPFDRERYFKLELEDPDFQHGIYPMVQHQAATVRDMRTRSLRVNPPYTPEVQGLTFGYRASARIDYGAEERASTIDRFYHMHPFGCVDLGDIKEGEDHARVFHLLPQYDDEGYLYIGVEDILPPQDLSILFQMASGSEDRGIEKPEVRWAYLRGGRWEDFKATEIFSDSTNGMVDSGIIRFYLPEGATSENSLMPGGMHWLRAQLQKGAAAIPDTVDVKAQAVTATFQDQDNAPDHLKKPLPPFAVTELVDRDPGIANVLQPYSSFHGRMREDAGVFYTRVSERLRHKQRALTPWDYERLVLDRFPEIFQAKCLNGLEKVMQGNGPGSADVTVVVVPDVSNTTPSFPLEPRAPLYLLEEIESYLRPYIPPFVDLTVKNPRYEQITYRVAVRFKRGYGHYYIKQLNKELKRFLTPWAYEADQDLPFGNCIYNSSIIHFIEKRPYVDYVAKVKLFEQVILGQDRRDEEMTYRHVESNVAWVQNPDAIFISAPEHVIDVITMEKYRPEDFEGIGYMMVGLDFEVD
ncbi:MAG: hypothetical protein GY849_08325, partial [Deltaproteobacteria bacterium]|nr:hypothetical protein [Deltaproteobacteria bacterium]